MTSSHSAFLRDQLLNINVEAFSEGGFVNDISEYVAGMEYDAGLEYLMAVSGEESPTKFISVLKQLERRKNGGSNTNNNKKPPAPQAKTVFWGPTQPINNNNDNNNNKKKKKKNSRGKSILSTSMKKNYNNNKNVDNNTSSSTTRNTSSSSNKSNSSGRVKGDYSDYFKGKTTNMKKTNNKNDNDDEKQQTRGSNYTNCALCGSIIWYNLPEQRICNSKLHPECENRPIDSVDPRTGLIDFDYGGKRLSNKNKKKKEQALENDPETKKYLDGYATAFEQKERLVHFDREVAARSRVFDDQNDYFQDSNDRWLSQAERDLARRKAEAIREKKTMKRRNVQISFDIAGRRVMSYNEDDNDNDTNNMQKNNNNNSKNMTTLLSSNMNPTKKSSDGSRKNKFGIEKDVLEQNEGTGLHQNVLFGRAGEIYKRIQTSLLYDDDGTEAEEDDDKNRSNKKKALNLPRKNRRVIINPEEDFDDDEP